MKNKKDNKKHIDAEINRVLLNDFDRIESFVIGKWKYMCIGAVVIIVLVAVGYGVMAKKESNENTVRQAIANASTKAELIEVLGKYGNTKEAENVRFKLAFVYSSEKKYDEAAELYRTIARTSAVNEVKARAAVNEAFMLENAKKTAEAANAFANVGNNKLFPVGIRSEAFYGAVRMAVKLNKKDDAAKNLAALKTLSNNEEAVQWVNLAKALTDK